MGYSRQYGYRKLAFRIFYSTDQAGDDIFEGLENIAEIIVNQAQAWILTDPMGEYIDFGDNTEIPRVTEKGEEGDYTVAFNTSTNTLVWNLRNDYLKNRAKSMVGITYKLTYSCYIRHAKKRVFQGKPVCN